MPEHANDPEFMLSLARGLEVLEVTARSAKPVTIAEASRATGLSRAAVRRCFHTLAVLGYVRQSGGAYVITVKAMTLSRSLVSPNSLAARAQPLLDRLRDELGESCTLGVLDEDQVHYLARAEAYRIMAIGLRVGSRLPLYNTSMGRVLLATCSPAEIDGYLARNALIATTNRTETDQVEFRAILHRVAMDGFAIVDQELELGLRSIAVPVTIRGVVVAALNIGTSTARVPLQQLRTKFRSRLQAIAQQIATMP